MAKKWLDERLETLIPALSLLTAEQEERIAQLCNEELAYWRSRMNKESALRPVVTAARKAISERIKLTQANRWMNAKKGEYQHLALKYINLDWDELNAVDDEKLRYRLEHQQLIENPSAIIAKAEKLLQSDQWEDILLALAIFTGCRETELLKTCRLFFKSLYTLEMDGQLKRRDLAVKPYEKPTLTLAESVINAWRRLRGLVDCSDLEIEEVSAKYSRVLSERANYHFTGLIPQRTGKENLYTHAFRAVYACIAVHWFCPKTVDHYTYVCAILGHHQAETERQRINFAATIHYVDYTIDGVKGVRLQEPGVKVLHRFEQKGDQRMTTETTQAGIETQAEQPLETTAHKTRGTFTTRPGTYQAGLQVAKERGYIGTGAHDRLIADLLQHDAVAHQMYVMLQPLAQGLNQDENSPLAILQALINAYQSGAAPAMPGMGELLQSLASDPLTIKVGEKPNEVEINSETKPVEYMAALVERDRKFKAGMDNRTSKLDVAAASMEDLKKSKAPAAATERFRRAVDAVIEHNNTTNDPLHQWYINAALIRDLVGGQNKLVQDYLKTRKAEIDAHHNQYGLTPKRNNKDMNVADEIKVQ